MKARAELTVEPGHGAPRLRWRCAPPLAVRQTGLHQVHLVQAAGGPLGGDELSLDVHLGAGTGLRLRSAAATVVQPGSPAAPARWTVSADLEGGAVLDWHPEPTVICDRAELQSSMTVALHGGARSILREVFVLGRDGQRGGRLAAELIVDYDGVSLLAHTLLLDGTDPGLTGPAGTGGARVIGMLVVVGEGGDDPTENAGEQPGLRWACSPLDGPGRLLVALGNRVADVNHLLDQESPNR